MPLNQTIVTPSDVLIDHFWGLLKEVYPENTPDGLCQCDTGRLIGMAADPDGMRAFLMVAVFIDQFVYSNYQAEYSEFRESFRLPKLYLHAGVGMASANHFAYNEEGGWLSIGDRFVLQRERYLLTT